MRAVLQDLLHQLGALGAGFARPFDESARRPFQVTLVTLGSMFIQAGKFARQVTARVSCHSLAVVKDFHGGGRRAGLQFLMNELVRNAVKMIRHAQMVVDIDFALGPSGQLEGRWGQGQQRGFLLRLKPTVARTFEFLKRLGVELFQQRPF